MQSLWFYLFDVWQETSAWLPVEAVLEDVDERVKSLAAAAAATTTGISSSERSSGSGSGKGKEKKKKPEDLVWGADKARTFEHDIRDALELFETVIWGRRRKVTVTPAERQRGEMGGCDTTERTIYDPTGQAWCPVGDYNTGPWVSGVKPWNQFLNAGGPGVVEPVFAELEQEDMSGDAAADGDRKKSVRTKRYIPQPGIAIIATHTERTRSLAEKFYATLEDNTAAGASLQDFNNHAPFFPTLDSTAHTYMSLLEGHTVSYTLSNGAPPVLRLEGYADPGMLVQDPDWNLVDDSVAICKGLDAYESISGEWDDEEGVFDMWTVVETRDLEEEERERGQREEGKLELGEMFDMWCGVDEC